MSTDRVEERAVAVGEFHVNVASAGSGGATVVLLHGEDRKPSWKDWEGFLELGKDFRLIIPDLVGFGKSSKPAEVPDYKTQARIMLELLDVLKIQSATFVGYSWGGQVALEVAIVRPEKVDKMILVASTYDKGQLPKLSKLGKPTLIVWAEDDLVTQVKAAYLLRDAIGSSRLEVLPPVAKDPKHDFRIAHTLLSSRKDDLLRLFRSFLASPSVAQPPDLEKELRGMAMKQETPDNWGKPS